MPPSSLPTPPAVGPSGLRRLLIAAGVPALLGGALTLAAPAQASPPGGSTTATLGEALAPSGQDQIQLTEHLRRIGALFYGAWWCPACFRQKNLFGQQAGDRLPYVECDKTDQGRERCQAAGIAAYPTWVLGERRLEGVQSLDALKRWSGFSPTSTSVSP
ncbi:hypothetical protein [Synechococcus sp. CCY 9618]|uniref:hypothetical protein n=1 Tax=Synechococcus sp. CCY 9618 TaxID=2815602 RepID=UPI001C229D24|nr:hypothetical protein [Synechococcus sp. CCY 9618]